MSIQRTPVSWLRMFDAAARHLSFSAAAQELHVTPSAVSQQVRLLEHRLGKALFQRHTRGLRLSVAGEMLLPVCRQSFDHLDAGLLELFGEQSGQRLVIRVALGFARSWLLTRLAEFSVAHPDIPVRLVASVWTGEPLDPNIEIDIRMVNGPVAGMATHLLTQDEIFAVCSPSLVLGPVALETVADLPAHPLLHSIGFAQGWSDWLAAAHLKRGVRPGDMEFDSMLLAEEMAATGYGIALSRSSFAHDLVEAGRLVPLFDVRIKAKDNIALVHALGLRATSPAALFRDWLLAQKR
jgi:LysR family glycine cleavage system transcriptional activator